MVNCIHMQSFELRGGIDQRAFVKSSKVGFQLQLPQPRMHQFSQLAHWGQFPLSHVKNKSFLYFLGQCACPKNGQLQRSIILNQPYPILRQMHWNASNRHASWLVVEFSTSSYPLITKKIFSGFFQVIIIFCKHNNLS